jgi:ADP-sugar diphosphatase
LKLILQPDDVPANSEDEKHVILAIQPRIAAASLAFAELPAGMIDDSGTFAGAAAKEITEETGLSIPEEELVDMTSLASLPPNQAGEGLHAGIYPSPGACDEFIPVFLNQKRVPRDQLKEWQGKLTGLRDEGEKITLKLVPLKDLWKEGARDGKTLAAWALYEGLKREGKV